MAEKTVPRATAPAECAGSTSLPRDNRRLYAMSPGTPGGTPGYFGLSAVRIGTTEDARLDELLFDALCLLDTAEAAFNLMQEASDEDSINLFPGLYLLRQARGAIAAAQIAPAAAQAAHAAGWRAGA